MRALKALVKRDMKLFFKDKGLFFTSLITPLVLLVLYGTFLGNIYEDIFLSALAPFSRGKAMAHRAASSQLRSAAWAKVCRSSQVAARLSP